MIKLKGELIMIYAVCPKCGRFEQSVPSATHEKCAHCGTIMVNTKYEFPYEATWEELNKLEEQILDEYVRNNPLFDEHEHKIAAEEQKKQDEANRHFVPKPQPKKNIPKCPTCGSTNVEKIGTLERGISVTAWGLFSSKLGKTMKCKNCGYKW